MVDEMSSDDVAWLNCAVPLMCEHDGQRQRAKQNNG